MTAAAETADEEIVEPPPVIRGSTAGANCIECPFSRMGKPNQPVTGEGSERPIWIIVGEGPGQNEVIQQRPFCLVPETLVLMADLTWKPIGDVHVGDKILSVDEESNLGRGASKRSARKWHVAEVTATHRRVAEILEVRTEKGVLRGSGDHPVLVRRGGKPWQRSSGATHWLEMGKLQTGENRASRIVFVTPPWTRRNDYEAAWLAGFFDGEGHITGSRPDLRRVSRDKKRGQDAKVGFSQNAGPTYERAVAAIRAIGYDVNAKHEQRTKGVVCNRATIHGDFATTLRFLGEVRPERLITNFQVAVEDKAVRGLESARVRSRAPIGVGELVDITTTTGTFIANGFVVHNCGASGRMVTDALSRIRVKRDSVWITNATLCIPPSGSTDSQKRKARECCTPRLKNELLQFPGRPILALGAIAAQGFCGDKFSISAMAGAYHEVDLARSPWKPLDVVQGPHSDAPAIEVADHTNGTDVHAIIPSIHPAAILRGGSGAGGGAHTSDLGFWSLCYDAQKVNLLARGADIKFTDDIEYETTNPVRAEQLVEEFVRAARAKRAFSCDTETYVDDPKKHSALQAAHAKLSAIGLATTDRAISVAWEILTPRAKRFIGAILSDPTITKTFHNGLYDVPVLNRHGFVVQGPREDTLLLHHSAFPGLAHDLQRVTTQFYCITPWKAEYRHGQGELSELLKYNARDTLATARIEAPLTIAIKRGQAEKTYEVDMAMARAAAIMHVKGVPIDRDVNEQLRVGFRTHIDRTRSELVAKVFDSGIHSRFKERLAFEQSRRLRKNDPLDLDERINKRIDEMDSGKKPFKFMIDSGDHIVAFLKACGVPLSIQTVSGRISTKKDILESFGHYPEVRALLTYRENAKLLNTFVERLFTREYAGGKIVYGFADEFDRVHPRWSVHKITGRWGSEAPGSQNWPKADKKKGRPNLRSQVVAPHGRAFVAFDAAQLEARIIALLSADPFLLDIFTNKKDIHSEMARIVWPDFDTRPVDERKVLRDMIKRPEYGAFYGGAVDTLWKAVVRDFPNVTISMIGKMVATMKVKMPGVTAWHQRMMRTADEVGEVRSAILGRRRCFPLKQFELSEVVNFPVQSTGADIINLGLMDVMPRLPETTFPILQIHDAVVFECDEDDQDLVKQLVITSFTRDVSYEGVTVHFPVDARAGKTWAEVN